MTLYLDIQPQLMSKCPLRNGLRKVPHSSVMHGVTHIKLSIARDYAFSRGGKDHRSDPNF